MSQRSLLAVGVVAIAASVVIGAAGIASGRVGMPAGWFSPANASSISIDAAQSSVQSFLDRSGNKDLKIDELMEFQQNFYALIKEQSTGIGAFELLVNKTNGAVAFEPGPDMMWNTRYGTMAGGGMMRGGGMMGRFRPVASSGVMTVGAGAASGIAQRWLDANLPGDTAGTPDRFYGYYTFHFLQNGQIAGMLSVNGYTGQVWYHTWHGAFVQARDFGA